MDPDEIFVGLVGLVLAEIGLARTSTARFPRLYHCAALSDPELRPLELRAEPALEPFRSARYQRSAAGGFGRLIPEQSSSEQALGEVPRRLRAAPAPGSRQLDSRKRVPRLHTMSLATHRDSGFVPGRLA
ncbi:MAG TPA: hypothetical protein GYA07_14525 [Verrucomicrobia bacterium]|nr:hypothetical protein [Verrucomicrobiota bacterium]HOP97541.1 hypothetical protein [Verrucomicrobiota bacterium]HPU55610.1 hypothetical protein [Verrucomicrobiota bacterium]